MGKAGHLARHAAQAETGIGRIIGGFQPPIIEAETLAGAILQIEFAIVAAFKRIGGQAAGAVGIEQARTIEQATGVGKVRGNIGHAIRYRDGITQAQRKS